jgi:uncharacterized protein (TIGR00299 family) protein
MISGGAPLPAKIAYADCFSGISGDMFLAALIDLGLDADFLRHELDKLAIGPFDLTITSAQRAGIKACAIDIKAGANQQFRNLDAIRGILSASGLEPVITDRAGAVFSALAAAEAKVHGLPVEQIHFHEIGAIDTIIDIVGVVIGLHALGIEQLFCSPLPWGRGFVQCAHGHLPLPAPAVCALLAGAPVYGVDETEELVTPTGAALLAALTKGFGPIPDMNIARTGYGAGTRQLASGQANVLRLIIGASSATAQTVEIIETHLDDWNSEGFPYLCELLLAQGALDVSLTPLLMKKGRPGQLLRVICPPARGLGLKQTILTETTAIGLRFHTESRMTLPREQVEVETPWGKIVAKKVQTPAGEIIYPEYEACKEVARARKVPLQQVYREVCMAPRQQAGENQQEIGGEDENG